MKLAVFLALAMASGTVGASAQEASPEYDLVLDVSPIEVKAITRGATADAVEDISGRLHEIRAIVVFRIEKVVEGELPKVRIKPPTAKERMQEAVKEKEFWRIFLKDDQDTMTEFERSRFKVGVRDPEAVFGITSWTKPDKRIYRLFLRRHENDPRTFILIRSETL